MRVTLGHKGRYHFSETGDQERDEVLMSLIGGLPVTDPAPIGRIAAVLAARIGSQTEIVKIGPVTISSARNTRWHLILIWRFYSTASSRAAYSRTPTAH